MDSTLGDKTGGMRERERERLRVTIVDLLLEKRYTVTLSKE
jgi:hypothetical protein